MENKITVKIGAIEAAALCEFAERSIKLLAAKKEEQGLNPHEEMILSGLRTLDAQCWKGLEGITGNDFDRAIIQYQQESKQSKLN